MSSPSPEQQRLRDAIYPNWSAAKAALDAGASLDAIADPEFDESEFCEWIGEYINFYYIPLDYIGGCNVNSITGPMRGTSPLVMAMFARHFRLFAELIKQGADVNQICHANDGPMTAMDFMFMEYACTTFPGEERVLDGMKELLLSCGAKHYYELHPPTEVS